MGKITKKLIAILLCVAMIGTWLPMGVFATEGETEYTLYPTPHSIAYADGSFELKDINVLYGTGVDEYTKARLEETAALRSLSVTEGTAADAEKTNVYVAIYGSGDAVESYILANYTVDTTLFEKTDAHFVAANNGEIVVLGKDTDSCFYGLTTIYQIFGQLTANTLRNLTINDYADVASRGFIEGYYGNPWSTEDRINLMTWGGYYKLNSYFYAPKDDPKHNSAWRELYTDEELETLIRPLAEAGNASKCRFVYALHPYMYNAIDHSTEDTYLADLAVLQAKFEQVISVGVRQIAILADDAANVGGSNYTRLLTDMTTWIQEKQATYPDLKLLLPFVTQEYMYFGESYYADFPENIQIVMTGGQVWGFCSQSFTDTFYTNVGRGVYLWINWPCTDNSKNHLIMGGYADFLHPGVDPSKVEGIVLNPMQQSEPSKVAIFGNACYTWNIWETEEEADAAWETSFACVDHNTVVPNDASNALKELSKHMIDQTRFEDNDEVLEESVVLREELSSFRTKLTAGTYTQEDIDSLVEEFTILQNAAKIYREQGNTAIVTQIEPWLGNWDDTTVSILSFLDALSAILNNEGDDVIWSNYAAGQAAYESSRNHPLWYMDHYEYAESGYRFIVPFMQALDAYLAEKVATIVDPNAQTTTYITNREDSPATGSVANVTDGNDSTSAIYKTPNAIVAGDYVGLMFSSVTSIRNIHIVLGAGKDHFDQGKLQYTMDGTTWQDLPLSGMENSFTGEQDVVQTVDVAQENLPAGFQAMGIRFIATADNAADAWLEVREVAVNYEPGESLTLTAFEGNAPDYYSGSLANMVDGNTSTFGWYTDYGRVGQYVGVDLGSVVKVGQVTFTQDSSDHFSNYTLQYSTDGTNYTDYATYSEAVLNVNLASAAIEARYIRFYSNATTSCWIKIYEIAVSAASDTTVMTNSTALASLNNRIVDGTAELVSTGSVTLTPGDYIGHDLARIKELESIAVDAQGALTLQISPNMVDWTTVTAGDVDADARYVRLINLTDADVTTTLNTFTVTYNEHTGPYLYETTMGINSSWGVSEDCRENGAAFDGDVTTMTEFGDLPQQGQYIIYDLSKSREISKLEIYCIDSALNYIRDAEMQISNDLVGWTTVLTIGDGVQNTDDASVTCINSDAGYSQATSTYPNYVSIEGTVEPQMARYIRILMTATNNNRAVVFYEIEVNGGEFLSASNDPTFESTAVEAYGYAPQNMTDGNLTTSWKPDTTEAGSIVYTFSDNLTANRINIAQKSVSNARISVYAENDGQRAWIDMGALDKSLVKLECDNDLNLALKIEWDANAAPNITEIVRYSEDTEEPVTHTPGDAVRENEVAATCTADGSYDSVVYCTDCGEEISRWTVAIPATGHSYADGICTVCGAEDETGVVRVNLEVGKTAEYTDNTGYYVDADASALDQNVATVTLTGTVSSENTLGEKVTAIESGSQYLIVNTRASKTLTNASASAAAAAGAGSGLSLNGTTASITDAAIWTIEGADGTYTVKDANGSYLTIGSNSAGISATAANIGLVYGGTTWTINQDGAYLNDFGELGTCAAGWNGSGASTDSGSQWDIYKVDSATSGTTTITFTGVSAGETSVQIGETTYKITVTGEAHVHTPGEAVRENEVAPTCTAEGSYESVVRCSECGEEISRETVTVPVVDHTFENGVCTVCGMGIAYNVDTDTGYATLAEALAAAQAGQTVKLLADTTEAKVMVNPGVTLELNGHQLTATYVVGFNTAHVIDTAGSGKVIAGADHVVLDEANSMIPVYDGTGYIFTKAGFAIQHNDTYTEGFKINAVACPVNMDVVELLKNGAADNNIQIMIQLTWDTADGTGSQRFVFKDEVVAEVYSSNAGDWDSYDKMFSLVVTDYEGIDNLKANIMVVSGTNVEYVSSQSLDIA